MSSSALEDLLSQREKIENPASTCLVCQWLESQTDTKLKEAVSNWIHDGLSRRALVRTLKPHGLKVGQTTMDKHANKCVLELKYDE